MSKTTYKDQFTPHLFYRSQLLDHEWLSFNGIEYIKETEEIDDDCVIAEYKHIFVNMIISQDRL
jgi:hypothetical protein